MLRPIHFEVNADNPERAIAFYKNVFGWEFNRWGSEPYWLIKTGPDNQPGINGGLMVRRGPPAVEGQAINALACTIDVPNVDEYQARAERHGATVAMAKVPVPGIGWLVYIRDTEGNLVGMMQTDPKAALPR